MDKYVILNKYCIDLVEVVEQFFFLGVFIKIGGNITTTTSIGDICL